MAQFALNTSVRFATPEGKSVLALEDSLIRVGKSGRVILVAVRRKVGSEIKVVTKERPTTTRLTDIKDLVSVAKV